MAPAGRRESVGKGQENGAAAAVAAAADDDDDADAAAAASLPFPPPPAAPPRGEAHPGHPGPEQLADALVGPPSPARAPRHADGGGGALEGRLEVRDDAHPLEALDAARELGAVVVEGVAAGRDDHQVVHAEVGRRPAGRADVGGRPGGDEDDAEAGGERGRRRRRRRRLLLVVVVVVDGAAAVIQWRGRGGRMELYSSSPRMSMIRIAWFCSPEGCRAVERVQRSGRARSKKKEVQRHRVL